MENPSDPPAPVRHWQRVARFVRAHKKLVVAFALLLPFLAYGIDRATHHGRVLRGVIVSGASFSGFSRAEAEARARETGEQLRALPLVGVIRGQRFEVKPEELGFEVDVGRTVERAMSAGRSQGFILGFAVWLASSDSRLDAAVRFDEARLHGWLDDLEARAVEDRPFSGGVRVENGHARPDPPRAGFVIDRASALDLLMARFASPSREPVELPLVEMKPFVADGAVDAAVPRAEKLISGDIELVADGSPARVTFAKDELTRALKSREPTPAEPEVKLSFDTDVVDQRLASLRAEIERPPENARFIVEPGDKLRIVPSRSGTLIRADRVADALLEAGSAPGRVGALPLVVGAQPELTTADLEGMKITGLVSQYTTHHVCCQPRVDNIHRAADLIDGKIIKPGAIMSLNVELGTRTTKNGFKPAPTIEEGEMVDALGGGTSQFATTFFNAIFLGGYDIIERVPHTYYFSRYPMGRDATLSWPKPDIIFENDTQAGMLIKASYTDTSITVKIYGDNGGRKVSFEVSNQLDAQKPGIEYIPDMTQSPDKEKVKEGGQIGWTVYVTREIRFPDGTKKEEKRKVVYKPRIRRVIVHPCRVPAGEPGHTGEPCPVREGGVEGGTE